MIANTHYGYVGNSKAPEFTYTGNYNVRDDGVVELLTSGTLVFLNTALIDVFCVGGGGAGGDTGVKATQAGGGGGGGYTATARKITVNGSYDVTIGAGGNPQPNPGVSGGTTSFGTILSANGGWTIGKRNYSSEGTSDGAQGGSGGGGGTLKNSYGGVGGSNGSNGERGGNNGGSGGQGQSTTTREFGEDSGKLYAGAGGGGRYMASDAAITSMGGEGGGGTGGWTSFTGTLNVQNAAAGVANTGGGGGGGSTFSSYSGQYNAKAASGGSGIVCFREAK